MIQLAFAHGVNHGPADQRSFVGWWAEPLAPVLGDMVCTGITWHSRNNGIEDGRRMITDRSFREDAVGMVEKGLVEWSRGLDPTLPTAIVAHSMGTILVAAAANRKGPKAIPIVNVGSPVTHPLYGRALEAVGLAKAPPGPVVTFQNRDDGICALGTPWGRWMLHRPGWAVSEVEVDAPTLAWPREHPQDLYFNAPEVGAALQALAGVG